MNLFENLQLMKENDIKHFNKNNYELKEGKSSASMTRKGQVIQNYDWAKYPIGTYVRMFTDGTNSTKCNIKCDRPAIAGKVKATYVYNEDAAKEMGLNYYKDNSSWVNDPNAPQSCLIEIHPDFKVKQHGQSTERIIVPADFLDEISEQDYKDMVNRIPRKGFDKLINKNKKRIESKIVESTELRPFTGIDSAGWGGVHNFADDTKPMIAEGEFATLLVGRSDDDVNSETATISIYFGEDGESWGWKSCANKEIAIKDAKVLAKLVDEEIDIEQLERFGFEML